MNFSKGQSLFFFVCCICMTSASISDHRNWDLIQNDRCGESLQLSDRIIGGKEAALGQYPWIARLGVSLAGTNIFVAFGCGSALITKRYVLSAAHCIVDEPLLELTVVRIGENYEGSKSSVDCSETMCAPPVQDIKPQSVIVHNLYNKNGFSNDISLIRLKKPAVLNDFVVPICLPTEKLMHKDLTSQSMEVAGWGVTNSTTGKTSKELLYIYIDVQPVQVCQKFFAKSTRVNDEGQLCVGGKRGIDTCIGDSGGPLMKVEMVNGRPKYVLFGVVSFGPRVCGIGPAIYTDVRYFLPWILDHMKE